MSDGNKVPNYPVGNPSTPMYPAQQHGNAQLPVYPGYQQLPYPTYPQGVELPPPYSAMPQQQQQPGPPMYVYQPRPQMTVVMPEGFNAGARFDANARPHIPPPPPGVAPNAAQMAMMQGGTVVMGQQKETFLSGAKGGGYTFW